MTDFEATSTEKVLTRKDGPKRWLVMNQPEKHNAMSLDMSLAATEVLKNFAAADDERVLIIAGAGDKAFVSGADISEFEKQRTDASASRDYNRVMSGLYFTLRDLEKPTIAMIGGYCLGGGLTLASFCDIRVCSEDATFAVPAAKLGIGYGAAYLAPLIALVGPSWTKELLYTGRRYDADMARTTGLVNHVVARDELGDFVEKLADDIGANAPLTQRATKFIVDDLGRRESEQSPDAWDPMVAACMDSQDYQDARRAFMEKRKPVFKGR